MHFKCIGVTQSTFAKRSLSLLNDAELSQGRCSARDDLSDGPLYPPIPPGIKEGDSGAEWQLYALSAFQISLFFSPSLLFSPSSEFLCIKLLDSRPFLPAGKQKEAEAARRA